MAAMYSDLGRSVKMRLYSLQKRHILFVFMCFFAAFFIAINIGLFGPRMLKVISVRASNMTNIVNFKSGPFKLETPQLGRFHQQLWITAQPVISGRKEEFTKEFIMSVHLHSSAAGEETPDQIIHSVYHNRTRYLHCINQVCDVFNTLHLDYIHNERYTIDLTFFNLEDSKSFEIKDFIFTFNSFSPSFTKFELWVRFVFLAITFAVLILYTKSLQKFSLRDWSIEQKWLFILLRSLLFFNNPLFPLIVLVDSWIPHLLDAIFQSTYLALLMVFWLSFYHGVRQSDRNFLTFYVPKFLIVFTVWLMSLVLLLWQQIRSMSDPTYNLTLDESYYFVFRTAFLVFFVIYLLFLLYLLVRSIAELKNMPYYDTRIKFSTTLMFTVIVSLLIMGVLRVRSDPFSQSLLENFIKNYRNTVEFCSIFALFNFYTFTLAFVYSPAKNASNDTDYADNPTFAMLNDTDEEDVVYGMDTLNKPLNQ